MVLILYRGLTPPKMVSNFHDFVRFFFHSFPKSGLILLGDRPQSHHVPSKPTQLLKMTIEIMDLPSKHGDFPEFC